MNKVYLVELLEDWSYYITLKVCKTEKRAIRELNNFCKSHPKRHLQIIEFRVLQ